MWKVVSGRRAIRLMVGAAVDNDFWPATWDPGGRPFLQGIAFSHPIMVTF